MTWNGVLTADNSVNPTMSLKYIVTQSKLSASTGSPLFSASATDLFVNKKSTFRFDYSIWSIPLRWSGGLVQQKKNVGIQVRSLFNFPCQNSFAVFQGFRKFKKVDKLCLTPLTSAAFDVATLRFFSSLPSIDWFVPEQVPPNCRRIFPLSLTCYRKCSVSVPPGKRNNYSKQFLFQLNSRACLTCISFNLILTYRMSGLCSGSSCQQACMQQVM